MNIFNSEFNNEIYVNEGFKICKLLVSRAVKVTFGECENLKWEEINVSERKKERENPALRSLTLKFTSLSLLSFSLSLSKH